MMATSQSLDRGLDILEIINAADQPMGIREVARQLDISPPIVQRLINTLAQRRYLRQDPQSRRYSIGYQALSFIASLNANDALIVEARPEMVQLTKTLPLDTYLAVRQGPQAIYLLCVQSEGPVTVRSEPGQLLPLHSTAIGKIFLSDMGIEAAKDLLGPGPLPAITSATVTDPALLLQQLDSVRAKGVATVENENIMGITSAGAPIHDASGRICAAVSASFSPHFNPQLDIHQVITEVKAAADHISAKLGFRGRSPMAAAPSATPGHQGKRRQPA